MMFLKFLKILEKTILKNKFKNLPSQFDYFLVKIQQFHNYRFNDQARKLATRIDA